MSDRCRDLHRSDGTFGMSVIIIATQVGGGMHLHRVTKSGHYRSARYDIGEATDPASSPTNDTSSSHVKSALRMVCSSSVSIRMANSAVSSRGRRALVVEDNAIMRLVVRKLMKEQGIVLEEAENGKVAVESVKEGKSYDLILMDREMSVMDGHEATKQLRLLGVKTPIVALSSDSQQCDRDLFLRAGADEFVEKPLTKDKLAGILSKYGLQ
ncbi:hypothetical protein ZIOFF_067648 [Zingiber officinale]|uniref:Response regulatory domain-containing protein n=1 Tax=Zingiber officinale TaxID=94328 RepID=A0A8J5C421_ZINOF|nr:hypothetical protein ZIOFF_069378 [Zingiber officinale]KAG6473731.1 hypothetical protein ZIOFF_067648 [Zingiber officinale]